MQKIKHMKYLLITYIIITAITYQHAHAAEAIPLNRQIISQCAARMAEAIYSVTPEEQSLSQHDVTLHKRLVHRMLVAPILSCGYAYEASVLAIVQEGANIIRRGHAALRDDRDKLYARDVVFMMYSISIAADHLAAYGYISRATRARLDNIVNSIGGIVDDKKK